MMKRFTSQAHKSVNMIRLFIGFALLASTLVLPVGVAQAAETVEPEAPGKMFPESHNVAKRQKFIDSDLSDEKVDCSFKDKDGKDAGAALYQIIKSDNKTYLVKYDPEKGTYTDKTEIEGVKDKDENRTGKTLNGLVIDPDGRVFATHMWTNDDADFVQILPKSGKFEKLLTLPNIGSSYNTGTYIEENGKPYALVASGFSKKAQKIDLNQIPSKATQIDLAPKKNQGKVKDFVWVQEGLEFKGHTYYIVGIFVKGSKLDVHLSDLKGNDAKTEKPSIDLGTKEFDGEYGAAYNFKPVDDINSKTTQMFFSNNKVGGMMKLNFDGKDFTLSKIGPSDVTNDNDGGGCPFTQAVLGVVKVINAECVFDDPSGNGSYFEIEITNLDKDSDKTFQVYATVDGNSTTTQKTENAGSTVSAGENLNPYEITVNKNSTAKIKANVQWMQEWDVRVFIGEEAATAEEIDFEPHGATLDESVCGKPPPPPPLFDPDVTNHVYTCLPNDIPRVTLTLDNSKSSVGATFTFEVTGGDAKEPVTLEKKESGTTVIFLGEDKEWSIKWTAKPTT